MARHPRVSDLDPFADLAKKVEVLEREMETQRRAIERLKEMGTAPRLPEYRRTAAVIRKTA